MRMMIKMGKTAFSVPSIKAHPTPMVLKPSGVNCMAGATMAASAMVTMSVRNALLWPAILNPSIKIKRSKMGIIEMIAVIKFIIW